MTPTEWSEDLLSAYVDGELDAERRAALEAHLAATPAWRQVLAEIQETKDAVRRLAPVDLSPEAWERLLARVAHDDTVPAGPPGRVLSWRDRFRQRPLRWTAAVAGTAAAAVVVAGLVLPGPHRVTPKVATFSNEQQAHASLAGDPVSSLAGVELMHGLGR